MGFSGDAVGKNLSANAGAGGHAGSTLGLEVPLKEKKATYSSILARIILWTEKLGGLYSPRGCKESDMTEVTEHTHFMMKC